MRCVFSEERTRLSEYYVDELRLMKANKIHLLIPYCMTHTNILIGVVFENSKLESMNKSNTFFAPNTRQT
jgi:hypothetical protein